MPTPRLSQALKRSKTVELAKLGTLPEAVHVFDEPDILAIDAAVAARRPLLVKGEPGTGKSQLARAAARALERAYVPFVVDSRTESRDLLWHFDAVARLADAQLGAAGRTAKAQSARVHDVLNYTHPGPLWWAFDWVSAAAQSERVNGLEPRQSDGGKSDNGCVVLIDEIDKAESDVPNGLLEALGAGQFRPPGFAGAVESCGVAPLVVVTTNEERALPAAFLRRCLVLTLELPHDRPPFIDCVVARGAKHFPGLDKTVLADAAALLFDDRANARENRHPGRPGQAEYFDLLRALDALEHDDTEAQKRLMGEVARYTLKKHVPSGPR